MSKKRVREPVQVNVTLVEIYEDLAHEDEAVRRKAAGALLTNILPSADNELVKNILTRLFRGLCSGRKAARPGFAVALTETLYQLRAKIIDQPDEAVSASQVIGILEERTSAEGNTSGQDERDHYFGRLFGCDAVIKSELLFNEQTSKQWDRLLDLMCGIAVKKPWLRQECGWALYDCIRSSLAQPKRQRYAVRILEKLNEQKLIRSPEGLALWILVQQKHPNAQLPRGIWNSENPLSLKGLQTLADVLKNAKSNSKEDAELEAQGSAMWSVNLHFVWDVVLSELFTDTSDQHAKRKALAQDFWHTVVDEALFSTSSSQERKHWGLLVIQKALEKTHAASPLVSVIFSKKATSQLVSSLKSSERYLQRTGQGVLQTLQRVAERAPENVDNYVVSLLKATEMADFDTVTNTKTIDDLLSVSSFDATLRLATALGDELGQGASADGAETTRKRRLVLSYQTKFVTQQVNDVLRNSTACKTDVVHTILHSWIDLCFGRSDFDEPMKKSVREKIRLAFEQLLKLGKSGRHLMLTLIEEIYRHNPTELATAEADVLEIVKTGWERYEKLHDLAIDSTTEKANGLLKPDSDEKSNAPQSQLGLAEGLTLLYGLILFEIHSGDTESIQILKELLDFEEENATDKEASSGTLLNADALVEILLSFASRPSKFLRRLTLVIFEALTPLITRDGLLSLTAVLETKETKSGQQELFEANGDGDELGDEEDEVDSDIEMLDSDVEVVSASESGSDSDSDSDSGSESGSTSDAKNDSVDNDEDANTADLLALETSLAAALGTRKLTQSDMANGTSTSLSDSDSDMTDSEMIALDEKLAEVFRNRASADNKKKDARQAKENIVNFKNRVLDMLEVYTRRERLNPLTLDLILPLLILSRTTRTKQLADRTTKSLQMFCKRCSGLQRAPVLPPFIDTTTTKSKKKSKVPPTTLPLGPTTEKTLALLSNIHTEAGRPNTSNAHRSTCSKTSLLTVKSLLKAGVPFDRIEAVYGATAAEMEAGRWNGQKAFFEEWEAWKRSVEGRV